MNRNSINHSNYSPILNSLRSRIKSLENDPRNPAEQLYDDSVLSPTSVQLEIILINKRYYNVRRVYMKNSKYRIGWIVDWDVQACMICNKEFGWFYARFKHHCRACGNLICHDCSPYLTTIPGIDELKGSRACLNCFGLKTTKVFETSPKPENTINSSNEIHFVSSKSDSQLYINNNDKVFQTLSNKTPSTSSIKSEDHIITNDDILSRGSVRRKKGIHSIASHGIKELSPQSTATIISAMGGKNVNFDKQIEEFEREQLPLYEQDYRKMREFIPVDIHKSNLKQLIMQGLPQPLAVRIWQTKILWLICMHKDDIYKIHLADFRSKYVPEGLDIVEMRAIWFNLPVWDETSSNALEAGKAEWRAGFKSKLDNQLYRLHSNSLPEHFLRNLAYKDHDLLHLFDPYLPLKTRFDRSASSKQYAVESPFDSNTMQMAGEDNMYNNPERTQQLPYQFPVNETTIGGTVQSKKINYLNNITHDNNIDNQEQNLENRKHIHKFSHNDLDSTTNNNNLHHHLNSNNETPYHQARLIDELNAEDDDDEYSFIHENTFIDNKVDTNDFDADSIDHREQSNNRSKRYNPNQTTAGSSPHRGENHWNKAPTPSNYSLGGDSQSTMTCNSISAGRKINSFRYRSAVSPKYHNDITTDFNNLKMEDKLVLNNLINKDIIAEEHSNGMNYHKSKSLNVNGLKSFDDSVIHNSNSYKGKAESSPATIMKRGKSMNDTKQQNRSNAMKSSSEKTPPLSSSLNNYHSINVIQSSNASSSSSSKQKKISSSHIQHNTSAINHHRVVQIVVPDQPISHSGTIPLRTTGLNATRSNPQKAEDHSVGTDINPGGIGTGGSVTSSKEEDSQSTTSSLSSVEVIHELITNYRVNFTNVASTNNNNNTNAISHNPPANHHHPPGGGHYDDALSYNTGDDVDITATVGEHLSTITSAHFAAQSDVGSIPSNSTMNPAPSGILRNTTVHTTLHNSNNNNNNNNIGVTAASIISNRSTSADESLGGATTPTGSAASSSIYRNKAIDKEQVKTYLLEGNAANALIILRNYSSIRRSNLLMEKQEASELLLQLLISSPENISIEVLKVFLDVLRADVNCVHQETGKSPLHYAVEMNNSELGSFLITRGADIFIEDHQIVAVSPLVLSLNLHQDWLLQAYEESGQQTKQLIDELPHSSDLLFRFTTSLIYAGYSKQAILMLQTNKIHISSEEATELLLSCQGNFESMRDPIETFELLESLGAVI